jgi:DNA-binding transcriptional LysR family regulator
MEIHQVRYFLAVAAELNFTRAAEHCNVSQPALTKAIGLLEQELGGQLFHRERARTHLSELGRIVQPHLTEVYEQTQVVKREAKQFAKMAKAELKVGVMCTIAPDQFVGLLGAVLTNCPGIELKIVDAGAASLEERLLKGELEIAIYCRPEVEPNDKLHYMPLFREQFVIVLHPQHKLAQRNVVTAAELTGQRYLNRTNCEFYHTVGPSWRAHGFDGLELVYRSERDDWILAMVASGLGFGFMPKACVTHPAVVTRTLIDPECWREINLVTVRGRPHSPAVGALLREAMRATWLGDEALAVKRARNGNR